VPRLGQRSQAPAGAVAPQPVTPLGDGSLGRAATSIAHELNNRVSVIVSSATLLAIDLGPDHPFREELDEILRAAEGAAQLVRDLAERARR
jgi:signal transduction histidine kinase